MYTELLSIITPVVVCALVGYVWTRLTVGYDTEFISRLVMYVGAPCLLIASLSQVELSLGLIGKVGLQAIIYVQEFQSQPQKSSESPKNLWSRGRLSINCLI